jgi:hypothetical protein
MVALLDLFDRDDFWCVVTVGGRAAKFGGGVDGLFRRHEGK